MHEPRHHHYHDRVVRGRLAAFNLMMRGLDFCCLFLVFMFACLGGKRCASRRHAQAPCACIWSVHSRTSVILRARAPARGVRFKFWTSWLQTIMRDAWLIHSKLITARRRHVQLARERDVDRDCDVHLAQQLAMERSSSAGRKHLELDR